MEIGNWNAESSTLQSKSSEWHAMYSVILRHAMVYMEIEVSLTLELIFVF